MAIAAIILTTKKRHYRENGNLQQYLTDSNLQAVQGDLRRLGDDGG